MMITLNGELLFDGRGSELAARDFDISDGLWFEPCRKLKMDHIPVTLPAPLGLLPVVGVGANQVGRLNLGRCAASLRYFDAYGQQEGYQPFGTNMARDPAVWMSWQQPQFSTVLPDHPRLQVSLSVWTSAVMLLLLHEVCFIRRFTSKCSSRSAESTAPWNLYPA